MPYYSRINQIVLLTCMLVFTQSVFAQRATSNWPQMFGPDGNGHAVADNLPVQWNKNTNVTWSAAIDGEGWSSPVIYDGQIWFTTAKDNGRQLFAVTVDAKTGKNIKYIKLKEVGDLQQKHQLNSYASPTPVIDGEQVYLHFGTYGTFCVNTKTHEIEWKREDLNVSHSVGPGSSPIGYDDKIIFHNDGTDKRYVIALYKKNGKTAWKAERSNTINKFKERKKSFCTPTLTKHNGMDMLISVAADSTFAYDPKTGKELWRYEYEGYSNVPKPLVYKGNVIFSSGYDVASLISFNIDSKLKGKNEENWEFSRKVPRRSTPIIVDDHIYMTSDTGIMQCLDANTGELKWVERLGRNINFCASPLYASGRIYVFNQEGTTTVIRPNPDKLDVLAQNELPAGCMATPAISNNALFIRTKTHLYRIENRKL